MSKPLAEKVALVTGASRGIGRATALELARAGAHIVAVARTVGALEEIDDAARAAGSSATLVPLDMRDYPALYRLAAALNERYQRLDVLVGNAGVVGQRSPLDHIEPQNWDEVMAVNVTANWHLIRAMDALLKRSAAGRAVFITSAEDEGGAQRTCAGLCSGDRVDSDPCEYVQSRTDPDQDAGGRHAWGRSDDPADA